MIDKSLTWSSEYRIWLALTQQSEVIHPRLSSDRWLIVQSEASHTMSLPSVLPTASNLSSGE